MVLSFLAASSLSLFQGGPAFYESEVFYQIFPRSYRDSNGDGIGDFKGIEQGLPAIQKLGCTVILINPIQKARVYHNYFADDWFDVDPAFGSLKDFDHLVAAAHKLGLKVLIDMEPQYAASGHPWYVAAAKDPTGTAAEVFAQPFKPDPNASYWYNGAKVQIANLAMNNPKVLPEITKVFEFWSKRGVDGYRIDHMMDDLDYAGKSKNLFATFWTPLEETIKKQFPGTFFVGEQSDWEAYRSAVEMLNQTPTDACYNFRLRNAILSFKKGIIEKNLEEYKYFTKEGKMQLTFLENHDMNRFASEEHDPRRQRLAAALMMFAKGAPIIYYGQEIGMKGEQGRWNSDGNDIPVRLGFRWGAKLNDARTPLWYKNSGPWWSTRYSKDNDGASLDEQQDMTGSLYNWYRKVIAVRKASPALSGGTQEILDIGLESVLAFRRKLGSESVVIYANLSDKPIRIKVMKPGIDLLNSKSLVKDSAKLTPWQIIAVKS